MKKLLLLLFLAIGLSAWSQIAVNSDGSSPDASAILDVKSTTKGLLLPRMTSAERLAIASPATGLTVYDLTTQSYWYYNGTSWAILGYSPWTVTGNNIYNSNSGNVGIGATNPFGKLHISSSGSLNLNLQGSSTVGTWFSLGNTSAGGTWYNIISTGSGNGEGKGKLLFMKGTGATNTSFNIMTFDSIGRVGISTTAPNPSAALDVSSTTRGFLPPRMNTAQRNAIATPAEGLVIYNTEDKTLNTYNGISWEAMTPKTPFVCGLSIRVDHIISAGVAPVNKTVEYGTVTGIPGEVAKCWITGNLGADHQATAKNDATEASAGWYWQFNRKQGFKHNGTTRTPNTTWITSINENLDWQATNDPCSIELGDGWRLPTFSEWTNVDGASGGNWTNWDGPWASGLKLHAAGYLSSGNGSLVSRGAVGQYWASTTVLPTDGTLLEFTSTFSDTFYDSKVPGRSVRCVK